LAAPAPARTEPVANPPLPQLLGCDFSSSPTRRKPVVLAWGHVQAGRVQLSRLEFADSLDRFSEIVGAPGDWLGGFDLPFGLPRPLVEALGWPLVWEDCIQHYASLSRADIRACFKAFCDARPAGSKFAHRATDLPAGSSSSMKWVNPPVAYMLHAGVPRLLAAGVHFPGLQAADAAPGAVCGHRVALEAYPGLLAREVLGRRSYKSDDRARQSAERLIARKDLVTALEMGRTRLGLRLKVTHAQRDALIDDGSADMLDAVLCLMQAAWASLRDQEGAPLYGLAPGFDPLEGWIISAP